jgi:superfamily II DNA or RNA helicase
MGRWDGKVPFFSMGGDTYVNLIEPMVDYIYNQHYDIEIDDLRTYNRDFQFDEIDEDFFSHITWPIGHPAAGKPIKLRPHQVTATNTFLTTYQGIQRLPTASGKTLITAVLSKKVEKYGRSIVIVPNKDLITQTETYYKTLGMDVGVYYGERKEFFKTHTICTWQSLEKLNQKPVDAGLKEFVTFEKFIQGVVAVIVDEAHMAKATVLKDMLCGHDLLAKIPIRWAVTGTIPKEEFDLMALNIGIGQVIGELASSDLQDIGILSTCDVKIYQLRDYKTFTDYQTELSYLVIDPDRLTYIAGLIIEASKTGNVLVLVGRKESGKLLSGLIPGSVFLSGSSSSTDRKTEYDQVSGTDDKVIIATAGIAAVGIDIPRINHLFLLEPGKSFVRCIQSVGRALRTASDKTHAIIHDVCSDCKYSARHLAARKKYYKEEKFPYTVAKIDWIV